MLCQIHALYERRDKYVCVIEKRGNGSYSNANAWKNSPCTFLSIAFTKHKTFFFVHHLMIFIVDFCTMNCNQVKLMILKGLWYLVGIKVCVTARHFRYQIPSSHLYVFSLHKGSFKSPKLQFCHNSNEKCRCRHIICVLLKRKENLSFFCLCIEQ